MLSLNKMGSLIEKLRCLRPKPAEGLIWNGSTLAVPPLFRPPPHSYAGHHGPWIEGYFYEFWQRYQATLPSEKLTRIYLPVLWTDYYLRYGIKKRDRRLARYLCRNLSLNRNYFTIIQNDDGILEEIPDNVLVFSAGGAGDVPIPLLKGDPPRAQRAKDILCSFMGSINTWNDRAGVRSTMYQALSKVPGFHFGSGSYAEFLDITSRSVFTLCPRGYGRTSFRMYEAMAAGSIPIYLWDDVPWLPYQDVLMWDEISISIPVGRVRELPDIIAGIPAERVAAMQARIRELFEEYFTLEGTCNQILRYVQQESSTNMDRR